MTESSDEQTKRGSSRRRVLGVLGAGLAVFLGTGAWAASKTRVFGWHGRGHAEHMREHFRALLEEALEEVGASEAQRAQVLEIADRMGAQLSDLHPDRAALHDAFTAQLSGQSIDRAALEELRREQVERIESVSQLLVAAFADAAEVLIPEQRLRLAELHRERWGHFGRWHH